jgi:hypothetical protein
MPGFECRRYLLTTGTGTFSDRSNDAVPCLNWWNVVDSGKPAFRNMRFQPHVWKLGAVTGLPFFVANSQPSLGLPFLAACLRSASKARDDILIVALLASVLGG